MILLARLMKVLNIFLENAKNCSFFYVFLFTFTLAYDKIDLL